MEWEVTWPPESGTAEGLSSRCSAHRSSLLVFADDRWCWRVKALRTGHLPCLPGLVACQWGSPPASSPTSGRRSVRAAHLPIQLGGAKGGITDEQVDKWEGSQGASSSPLFGHLPARAWATGGQRSCPAYPMTPHTAVDSEHHPCHWHYKDEVRGWEVGPRHPLLSNPLLQQSGALTPCITNTKAGPVTHTLLSSSFKFHVCAEWRCWQEQGHTLGEGGPSKVQLSGVKPCSPNPSCHSAVTCRRLLPDKTKKLRFVILCAFYHKRFINSVDVIENLYGFLF